jgi:hypothetical protein
VRGPLEPLNKDQMAAWQGVQPIGHTAYHHIGDDGALQPIGHTAYHHIGGFGDNNLWEIVRLAGMGLAAYHGYRRNNSIGWAVGWAVLAALSPPTSSIVVVAVAYSQGFGKRRTRKGR